MADNTAHSPFTVNIGLYQTGVEVTGIAEADIWYNTVEGKVKLQLDQGLIGHAGPRGAHPFIYGTSNGWYNLQTDASAVVTGAAVQNRAYAYPLYPGRNCTLAGLAVNNVAGGGAGSRPILMALYDSDATTGMPGALIASYSTSNASGTNAVISGWTVSTALTAYPYWVVFVLQSATLTAFTQYAGYSTMIPQITASLSLTQTDSFNCFYSDTGFSGAAPSTFGAVAGHAFGPAIYCKLTQ